MCAIILGIHYCHYFFRQMANFSSVLRSNIVLLGEEGYSQRDIADRLNVSKTGVQETLSRYRDTGSFTPKKRPGRPRKTTDRTDNIMRRIVVKNPRASSSFVPAHLLHHVDISTTTVRRRLSNNFKLRYFRAAAKPGFSQKNVKDRVNFCKAHKHWDAAQWSRFTRYSLLMFVLLVK